MIDIIPVLADLPSSRLAPRNSRGRNKIAELGELGPQCPHPCGAEGYQNEELAGTMLLDLLNHCVEDYRTIPCSRPICSET